MNPARTDWPQSMPSPSTVLRASAFAVWLVAAAAAQAQYKVVAPDGKVTYTDRAPTSGKFTTLGAHPPAAAPQGDAALPLELREPASRYPVTLYVTTGACEPCDSARTLLRQRGIPYAEKQVQSNEDLEALQRLSGGRDAPTLSIGAQTLRGFAPAVWSSYLDSAGYPRESQLPANYQYAAATPLTEHREAQATTPAAATPVPRADVPPAAPPASPSGIKF
jgi:glutaredoxin